MVRIGVVVAASAAWAFAPEQVLADLNDVDAYSVEWLVDSSDAIVIAIATHAGDAPAYQCERVLKNTTGKDAWPLTGIDRLWNAQRFHVPSGRRILLFARDRTVFYRICLHAPRALPREFKSRILWYRKHLPIRDDPSMSVCFGDYGQCIVVDKHGRILTAPDEVIELVARRIATPNTAQRIADPLKVEKRKCSAAPGWTWVLSRYLESPARFLGNDEVRYLMLVPCDSALMEKCLRWIRSGQSYEATWAIRQVKDFGAEPEIVRTLRKCLSHDASAVRQAALDVLRDFGVNDLSTTPTD
jgi:hypothetical protein